MRVEGREVGEWDSDGIYGEGLNEEREKVRERYREDKCVECKMCQAT